MPIPRPRRRRGAAGRAIGWSGRGAAVGLIVLLTAAAGGSASTGGFASLDTAMRGRLRGQRGGAVLVVRDRTQLHRRTFGAFRGTTRFPVASASKWLTSATLMTFVDEGRIALDDPVGRVLPSFRGANGSVTVRALLSHTSGLADLDCVGDVTTSLASCAAQAAATVAPHRPGTFFHYSSTGYEVAARVVEVLSGESFERAFEQRIARPTGMTRTRFDEVSGSATRTRNPDPAASAVSTLDDYARFLDMILHLGATPSHHVLTPASVLEIERDQVGGLDTRDDAAVQITKIATYGLGVWRDVAGPLDQTEIVSGNGGLGFYPWIDRGHDTYGVVAVADERGSDQAVPASQRVARLEWTAAAAPP